MTPFSVVEEGGLVMFNEIIDETDAIRRTAFVASDAVRESHGFGGCSGTVVAVVVQSASEAALQ